MRHATALAAEVGATDFERPLSARGRAAAAQAARQLRTAGAHADRLLFSPARRTRDTAAIVARELSLDALALVSVPELYAASAQTIREAIERWHHGAASLMVVGHNPGISDFGQELATGLAQPQLPTAGFWRIPFRTAAWELLTTKAGAPPK